MSGISSKAQPIWGGLQGYQVGVVNKTITGLHDRKDHRVVVKWPSGEEYPFPEENVAIVTDIELDMSRDVKAGKPPVRDDIWCLIRTSAGGFGLAVIEVQPFSDKSVKYVCSTSKLALPAVTGTDYNIVDIFLSNPDYNEVRVSELFSAAQHIYEVWDLPPLVDLPLPLPKFDSIRQAADKAPDGPAVCFFHTEHSLAEFTCAECCS